MRRFFLLSTMILLTQLRLLAQDGVGVGVTTPHPSAVMHVQSPASFKGMLIPRYDSVSKIPNPANGLIAYDQQRRTIAYYDSDYSTGAQWQYMRGVPIGAILMWSGSSTDVPDGFALCDGSTVNGRKTPDLVSSFIRGATETSDTYAGALDVIPNLATLDETTIYDLSFFRVPDTPCSAYDSVYTYSYERVGCDDASFNGVVNATWAAEDCASAQSLILIPTGCTLQNFTDCTVRANTTYYALTPQDCLNENIFVYWDLAYIIRVY